MKTKLTKKQKERLCSITNKFIDLVNKFNENYAVDAKESGFLLYLLNQQLENKNFKEYIVKGSK